MLVIYFYLEREYYKVLKFHVNNSSSSEISDLSFKHHPLLGAAPQCFKIKSTPGMLIREKTVSKNNLQQWYYFWQFSFSKMIHCSILFFFQYYLTLQSLISTKRLYILNPIQDGGQKCSPLPVFSPCNVRIIPKNCLTLSFNPFSTLFHSGKISRLYLVLVPNYRT